MFPDHYEQRRIFTWKWFKQTNKNNYVYISQVIFILKIHVKFQDAPQVFFPTFRCPIMTRLNVQKGGITLVDLNIPKRTLSAYVT